MKQAVLSVLKIVDSEQPFVLEIDATSIAVGVVLSQDGRPIAFESKKLSPSQHNWLVFKQELYAIVHCLKIWQHYLYGVDFKVYVDHHTLKYFCTQPNL